VLKVRSPVVFELLIYARGTSLSVVDRARASVMPSTMPPA
jgi:hypothetical protein